MTIKVLYVLALIFTFKFMQSLWNLVVKSELIACTICHFEFLFSTQTLVVKISGLLAFLYNCILHIGIVIKMFSLEI